MSDVLSGCYDEVRGTCCRWV